MLCLGNKDVCNNYLNLIRTIEQVQLNGKIAINSKGKSIFFNEEVSLLKQRVKEFENMLMSKNYQLLSIRKIHMKKKKGKKKDLMSIYSEFNSIFLFK